MGSDLPEVTETTPNGHPVPRPGGGEAVAGARDKAHAAAKRQVGGAAQ